MVAGVGLHCSHTDSDVRGPRLAIQKAYSHLLCVSETFPSPNPHPILLPRPTEPLASHGSLSLVATFSEYTAPWARVLTTSLLLPQHMETLAWHRAGAPAGCGEGPDETHLLETL